MSRKQTRKTEAEKEASAASRTAGQGKPGVSKAAGRDKSGGAKAEKKRFTVTKAAGVGIAVGVTLVVAALGVWHLAMKNGDMLWMAQQKSFFTGDRTFLADCMHQPGGFIAWAASYLTQFFYHPWPGTVIMVAMWVAAMWASKLAFRVNMAWTSVLAIPVVALLVGVVDTGYWLYYLKQEGYWFYGTVGYLASMLMMLAHNRLLRRRGDRLVGKVLIALTYPFLGWYSLLTLAYTAVVSVAEDGRHRPVVNENSFMEDVVDETRKWKRNRIKQPVLALMLMLVVPMAFYRLYSGVRFEDIWTAGFYRFCSNDYESMLPELPYIIMAAVPLLFPFLPKHGQTLRGGNAVAACMLALAMAAVAFLWTEKSDFQNSNYHTEIRMYRAADQGDWDKVLEEMAGIPGDASRQMVLLKNIALLNKGEMGTKMFHYNNMGEQPENGFDTLRVHMVQTAAPLIYYHHGKTNFASRWCIENSVEFGADFDNLKMLARCALVNGEMDAARKYLTILSTSQYHSQWANDLLPVTRNPKLLEKHHEFDNVRELYSHMGTVLDGDNGLCEMYLLNYFSNTMNKDSKLLQELTLNYAMVQKDIQLFWPRFFLYATLHKGEEMPTHYQEAAYLYGNLEPQTQSTQGMPFDQKIVERYQSFHQLSQQLLKSGMDVKQVGQAMKGSFGDTFWWFYFFCRDIHSY